MQHACASGKRTQMFQRNSGAAAHYAQRRIFAHALTQPSSRLVDLEPSSLVRHPAIQPARAALRRA
eukprot:6185483-Pleurochrysis_carterae.AAC.2